jgi:DNA-binding response OmpR family regulator
MLTVLNQPRSRKIGIAVGADDYLTKPYDSKVLFSKIKELLEKSIG